MPLSEEAGVREGQCFIYSVICSSAYMDRARLGDYTGKKNSNPFDLATDQFQVSNLKHSPTQSYMGKASMVRR
jgi:hypothetical protein